MSLSFFDDRLALPKLADAEKTGLEVQKALGAASIADMRRASRPTRFWRCRRTASLVAPEPYRFRRRSTAISCPTPSPLFSPPAIRMTSRPSSASRATKAPTNSKPPANLDAYVAAAHKLYGDRASKFLELYPAHDDAEAKRMGNTAAREALVETGTRKWALAQRATGKAPFYMYMFSRVHPFVADPKLFDHPQTIGAYHTSDVPYWFETQDALNSVPHHAQLDAV